MKISLIDDRSGREGKDSRRIQIYINFPFLPARLFGTPFTTIFVQLSSLNLFLISWSIYFHHFFWLNQRFEGIDVDPALQATRSS